MRAAAVAARDERRLRGLDSAHRSEDVLAAADLGRIAFRTDQHEIVVHDRIALDAFAFGHELLLGGTIMDEHDISIATPADVERLAGADRDDAHFDAGVLLEHRKQMGEQPGLLGRRRRRDDDELLLRGRERHAGRDKGRGNDCTSERAAIHRRSASI